MNLLSSGDHVVCCDDVYGGTHRLFQQVKTRAGLQFDFVDLTEKGNLEKALKENTKMVWVESPTNPLLKMIDIAAVSAVAKERKILTVVDNTFMSPYFQQPLNLGADLVVHSTTKYLNGHSDVIGGALLLNDNFLYERLKFLQNAIGAVPGPFDCWLVLRGIKTLGVRMRQHEANAMKIARFLDSHEAVTKVIYPGLPTHPQHDLAARQMSGYGGMISCELDEHVEATQFIHALKLFTCAESLGGVESLVEYPALMTHASLPKEHREKLGISERLVRLSVGIEDGNDLVADLDQALIAAWYGLSPL